MAGVYVGLGGRLARAARHAAIARRPLYATNEHRRGGPHPDQVDESGRRVEGNAAVRRDRFTAARGGGRNENLGESSQRSLRTLKLIDAFVTVNDFTENSPSTTA